MSNRLQCFIPYGGTMREMDPEFAHKLAVQARKERKPPPIAVKTVGENSAVKISAVMSIDGQEPRLYRPFVAMQTQQARKMAEAAVWVGAVFAFVALGVLAQYVGALTIDREPPPWQPRRMPMHAENPLLGMAKPVDFDAYFNGESES